MSSSVMCVTLRLKLSKYADIDKFSLQAVLIQYCDLATKLKIFRGNHNSQY